VQLNAGLAAAAAKAGGRELTPLAIAGWLLPLADPAPHVAVAT
jgi:hypothetical protein